MESQTQKMSTITGFSSRGSRWSGIPCQKWSRKFWIWKVKLCVNSVLTEPQSRP